MDLSWVKGGQYLFNFLEEDGKLKKIDVLSLFFSVRDWLQET